MSKIPLSKLANLCHRIGASYKAGVDVKSIWEREARHGSPAFRVAMRKVADRIAQGDSVAQGMQATDGYFPDLTVSIVAAGESGGRLERSFELLSHHYDTMLRFRREMQMRLAWPVLELALAIVVVGLLILLMGWATSFGSDSKPFDWFGWGWSTAQYFWAYVTLVTVIIVTSGLFIYGVRVGWFGLTPMRLARRVPVLGKTIQIFSLARFAWVLSAVYEAGMNTLDGVKLAFRATQNYFYQQLQDRVVDRLQAGRQLHESLRETDAFPDDFVMYVENGELTGEIPESMNRIAEEYTAEAEKNLNILSKILFMILFSIIALIIGVMIITLFIRVYYQPIQEFL